MVPAAEIETAHEKHHIVVLQISPSNKVSWKLKCVQYLKLRPVNMFLDTKLNVLL
jgi:hypothetical protein